MHKQKLIHNDKSVILSNIREVVFGLEDGMVSTLGAISGIAVGTGSHFAVILSGLVIIAVESISMGLGAFLSNSSEKALDRRKLREERLQITHNPEKEKLELKKFYLKDGWSKELAQAMSDYAGRRPKLLLKEMVNRELKICASPTYPFKRGVIMFFAYILGGLIPLASYFFIPLSQAIYFSIGFTLTGLFILGAAVGKLSFGNWLRNAFRMLIVGGLALSIGLIISQLSQRFIN